MNEHISYWLIPADPEKARLSKLIHDLAVRFEAPSFEPHVTLHSGPAESRERIDEVLSAAAGVAAEITLHSTGLSHSEYFTKTLFVEFAPDDALIALAEKLKQLSVPAENYELKPHLSLVYAHLAAAEKVALARALVVPATIRFAFLQAVGTGGPAFSRADVEAWRVWGEEPLG